jgi:hypothetical protein
MKPPIAWLMSSAIFWASASPVLTSRSGVVTSRMRAASVSGDTPSSAAATTLITSPSRSNHCCICGSVAVIRLAPPTESTSPYSKMPTIVTGTTPVRVASPTRWPIRRPSSSAVWLTTPTSPAAVGWRPATGLVGSNGSPAVDITALGAYWLAMRSPFTTRAPLSHSWPTARSTPGTASTCSTSESGSGRVPPKPAPNSTLGFTTASTPWLAVCSMSSNAVRIWSVRT